MLADLLPALVGLIDRVEECHRVGDVDQHRQAKLPGRFPDRDEPLIVHIHQLIVLILHLQSKRLPDLQSLCATFLLGPQPFCRPLREGVAHFAPPEPVHTAEDLEAIRRRVFEIIEMAFQDLLSPAAIQIHVMCDTCFIEQVQQFAKRLMIPSPAEGFREMIMRIDNREPRPVNQGCFGHKLGLRAKVFEQHGSPMAVTLEA